MCGNYTGVNRGLYRRIQDPNNEVLGSKYYNINGIWALKPLLFGSLDP